MALYDLDAAATHWINGFTGSSWLIDQSMIWVSAVGVPLLVLSVAALWWSGADRSFHRHVLISSGLSFLLGLAFNQLVLLLVHRVRPYDTGITELLIARSADPSFPSDHATASLAIAAALFSFRFRGWWLFLAAAVLISFSRIYIGTHYLSDVAGGWLTALVAVALVRIVYRKGNRVDALLTRML